MSNRVIINDVGPRDGLQNLAGQLSAEARGRLIEALVEAGLPAIEVGAFVSPKAVPAMAGTDRVVARLPDVPVYFSTLIPNLKGYELARAAGVRAVSIVVAATDGMNRANIRMSTDEAMAGCREIIARAREEGVETLAYIATAWACPYDGLTDTARVVRMAEQMRGWGADYVIAADTIGAAGPQAVAATMQALVAALGSDVLGCHFHDTRGMGVANVYAALEVGIRRFDAAIGGLGGCPFAPGATGNVATEDVVLLLAQAGFDTGVDLAKLIDAVDLAASLTGQCDGGRALPWLRRQRERGQLGAGLNDVAAAGSARPV